MIIIITTEEEITRALILMITIILILVTIKIPTSKIIQASVIHITAAPDMVVRDMKVVQDTTAMTITAEAAMKITIMMNFPAIIITEIITGTIAAIEITAAIITADIQDVTAHSITTAIIIKEASCKEETS